MTNMWAGEIANGDHYALAFRNEGGKWLVKVYSVTSNVKTGKTTSQVSMNAFPEETKELPLSRQEAEDMVQEYLSDMHPKSLELIVERLCAPVQASEG